MAFLSLLPFQQIHIFLTFALRDFQRRHSLFNGQPHRFHEVFDRGQDTFSNAFFLTPLLKLHMTDTSLSIVCVI